jgi:nucleotide-binding universal stress UspA family protein
MSSDMHLRRILVPLDGSDSSFQAAKYAIRLAKMANAELFFMHAVVNLPFLEYKSTAVVASSYKDEAKLHAGMWYGSIGDTASKEGVKFSSETLLNMVSVAEAIVRYAEDKKVDLIVMGTRGRSGIKRFLIGSVADTVVTHAKCPVLITK